MHEPKIIQHHHDCTVGEGLFLSAVVFCVTLLIVLCVGDPDLLDALTVRVSR